MKLVKVTWLDSSSHNNTDWRDLTKTTFGIVKCVSVGYITHKTRKYITVHPHLVLKENLGFGEISIPRCSILKIKKLK